MSEDPDLVMKAARAIGRKVRTAIGAELQKQAVGDHLQRLLFFGALSQLVIEVFTVAPTSNQPTPDERRAFFHEWVRVTTEDFEATLASLVVRADAQTTNVDAAGSQSGTGVRDDPAR